MSSVPHSEAAELLLEDAVRRARKLFSHAVHQSTPETRELRLGIARGMSEKVLSAAGEQVNYLMSSPERESTDICSWADCTWAPSSWSKYCSLHGGEAGVDEAITEAVETIEASMEETLILEDLGGDLGGDNPTEEIAPVEAEAEEE